MYTLTDLNESWTLLQTEDYEFKKLIIDSLSVFVEGYKFTPQFRAGIWDGKKHFEQITPEGDIRLPKGLVAYVLKRFKEENKDFTYNRITYDIQEPTKEEFDQFVSTLGLPFTPYDYQLQSSFDAIRHKRLTVIAATGAGKSLIIGNMLQWFHKEQRKALLLVPNVLLVTQMKQDMYDYYGKNKFTDGIVTIGGDDLLTLDEKEAVFEADGLIISTWQSLYNNPELMENIEVLIADEAHGAKSEVYDTLLSNAVNCKWRIGLTGTLPRNYADKMSIMAALGKSKTYITPQGLVERGLATPVYISTLFMNYSQEDRKVVKALKTYQDEVKFINQHEGRNNKISQIASKLSEKGNTLLLFDNIAHGKRLLEMLITNKFNIPKARLLDKFTPKFIKEAYEEDATLFFNGDITEKEITKFKKVLKDNEWDYDASKLKSLADFDIYFIYGGVDAEQREYIRNVIETRDSAIVLATYGTMSTGVNIPKLHNIILAASTKSFIRLGQSIGRGMRKHSSKERMNLVDVCDDLQWHTARSVKKNFVYKHFQERLANYMEWKYPITEKEIMLG